MTDHETEEPGPALFELPPAEIDEAPDAREDSGGRLGLRLGLAALVIAGTVAGSFAVPRPERLEPVPAAADTPAPPTAGDDDTAEGDVEALLDSIESGSWMEEEPAAARQELRTGCGGVPDTTSPGLASGADVGWTTARDEAGVISFMHPFDWDVEDDGDGGATVTAPDRGHGAVTVTFTVVKTLMSPETVEAAALQGLPTDVELLGARAVEVVGHRGCRFDIQYPVRGDYGGASGELTVATTGTYGLIVLVVIPPGADGEDARDGRRIASSLALEEMA